MTPPLVGRGVAIGAVDALLDSFAVEAATLIIEGEPGIGKTAVWLDALTRCRERGVRVLAARASAAESVLAYAAVTDLLADVDRGLWADLPRPQRQALAAALLEDYDGEPPVADPRAVGAALLSVLRWLTHDTPVLVAIDDTQWLDASSAAAVAFAVRRLSGRLGVIATERTGAPSAATDWLQTARPGTPRRIRLPPLEIGDLHDLLSSALGHRVSRANLLRIHQMSRGNPFYALELARELDRSPPDAHLALPTSLAELMRTRLAHLRDDSAVALLTISSLGEPSVSLVAEALDLSSSELVALLGDAEEQGVISIAGQRLAFTHPLLAHAVYTDAAPAQRRSTHRRLAQVVTESELRARHLALADPAGEPETLAALDAAAAIARVRGAPASAAEMLELAIDRGGATHRRRILLAQCLFDSGDPRRARSVLEATIADSQSGYERAEARQRLAMVRLYDDSFDDASNELEQALTDAGEDPERHAGLHVMLAFTHLNSGRPDIAASSAERAFTAAEALRAPELLAQARGMRAMLRFFSGEQLEPADLRTESGAAAVDTGVPAALRSDVQSVLLRGWTGDYRESRTDLAKIATHSAARGEEGELMFFDFQMTLLDIWRGDMAAASKTADAALIRARHLDTQAARFIATSLQAAVAAYEGRQRDARHHIDAALAAGAQSGYVLMMGYVVTLQGFLEVSLGNHERALEYLRPQLPMMHQRPRCSELLVASFVPDAAEALVNRGEFDEAAKLVRALEEDGKRLDRPWMLAVGARCRAVLTAARGDARTAAETAREALHHHDRLDMPFERARTLLVLGRLERRLRRWRPATVALSEALNLFERVGTPLWTAQARADLSRGMPGRKKAAGLTPSERRVAELAAEGMSTKDIAARLFVSRKTVGTHLSRVYAKLGVHSRIELVHAMRKSHGGLD